MMKSTLCIIGFVISWICILPLATADSIYTWVDKNGVKQFSNEPPPEGVEEYQHFEGRSGETRTNLGRSQQRRRSYDAMVEEAKRESRLSQEDRLYKERARKAEEQAAFEKELKVKVVVEQIRLKALLKKAKNRGLSRTYSQGMRQSKIDGIQKQIDQLEESPQTYFGGKGTPSTGATESQSGY